ncbi:hypothetical protein [Sphingopyxis sp. RIFCSPHIGHO2_12_FULL_65_19]|uniref:hypothetical protein n=1 Tax=Sphingopyxis sp. RIFCSPHIGHO2_12_FULL_65_19 TaxID=1802172 RepID=UPI0008B76085|nr:hypothetical protein [Sphingopyxis sp. RIFCSPHIGHO2_12_FULL_65_19]OHD09925.1 MAG: hypothetical protein A3E77_11830 [Sphingopyxis sp. RIFCSPHIGHO2_12_FULL_65_19]
MKKVMLAASVLALAIAGAPAYAQTLGGGTNTNGAAGNNSDTLVVNDLIDLFVQDNAADTFSDDDQDNDGNGSFNGNNLVVATQSLSANNTNQNLDEVVDMDGEDDSDTNVGYQSGNNSVRGNAFAAYAGILNAAWNTGINANTQAATNIAAQGTVNFGTGGGDGNGGGGD